MNDKQQIEEMAKVINDYLEGKIGGNEETLAKHLYEKIIPKDSVVLTKEEYDEIKQAEELCKLKNEEINDLTNANVRYGIALENKGKETAREIFDALGFITYRKQGKAYIFDVKELRELAKQYGVEVEK